MSDAHDWQELIDRHLRGELNESEKERLAELLDSDAAARKNFVEQVQWDTRLAEVLRDSRGSLREPNVDEGADAIFAERTATVSERTPTITLTQALLAISAVIIIALSASLYFQWPSKEQSIEKVAVQQSEVVRPIAKITGISGSLQWTGDGGRVSYDLSLGADLAGGTVEGLSPGSWFELTFGDGSTVAISGNSMLTISDQGQKELHLKEGHLSSKVKPQPAGKPMLIYTRSALLEVLGTQFEIEAETVATVVNVSEGRVRVTRFSDGSTVDVPASHRVIAAADREMRPEPVPDSVIRWKSQLQIGLDAGRGKWSPETESQDARLAAIPYASPLGQLIYTVSFDVSRGDEPPVTLQPGSSLRVRGRLTSTHRLYFGVTVGHASGEFAGRFQIVRPADEFPSGQDFEVLLHLRDFRLDPSLGQLKDKLPRDPFGLVIESVWCHTLDKQAGLEIAEVELAPAMDDASKE